MTGIPDRLTVREQQGEGQPLARGSVQRLLLRDAKEAGTHSELPATWVGAMGRMNIDTLITSSCTLAAIVAPWGARLVLAAAEINPPGLDLGTASSSAILGWLVWHTVREMRQESRANREATAKLVDTFVAAHERRDNQFNELVRRGEEGHPPDGPPPRGRGRL